jgi:Icc-related predicted phosphoesterase
MEPDVPSAPERLLAVIGDVHAHWSRLEAVLAHLDALPRLDAALLVGDIGAEPPFAVGRRGPAAEALRAESIAAVLARVRGLGVPIAWVPGNHDPPRRDLPDCVDGSATRIAGLTIAGIGGAGPGRFGFPYEWTEAEARERVRALPPCEILISHTPPHASGLDTVARGGRAVGSRSIHELCLRHRGVMVCGHIHEAPGAVRIGDCLCANAGGLGEPYGRAQLLLVSVRGPERAREYEIRHLDLESESERRWVAGPIALCGA